VEAVQGDERPSVHELDQLAAFLIVERIRELRT
jgi:hypothetical protein